MRPDLNILVLEFLLTLGVRYRYQVLVSFPTEFPQQDISVSCTESLVVFLPQLGGVTGGVQREDEMRVVRAVLWILLPLLEVEGLMRLIEAMLLTAAAALASVHQQVVIVDVTVLHHSQSVLSHTPEVSLQDVTLI